MKLLDKIVFWGLFWLSGVAFGYWWGFSAMLKYNIIAEVLK
jgi:hypothetical protein